MADKKIGLCSLDEEYSKSFAESTQKKYIVFSEMVLNFVNENIATLKNVGKPKDLFLPTVRFLNSVPHEMLVLDMEVLMHDEVVEEIKKSYKLCFLKVDGTKSSVSRIMRDDYVARLNKICEEVI